MQIEWQIAPQNNWQADALLFFVFEKPHGYLPGFMEFLENAGKWLAGSVALSDFRAKRSEVALIYAPPDSGPPRRIILAGLGPQEQFEPERLKNAVAFAMRKCRDSGINRPGIPVSALEFPPCAAGSDNPPQSSQIEVLLREAVVGALAGPHLFSELKTKDEDAPKDPESLLLLGDREPGPVLRATAEVAQAEAAGIVLARDLTISPANRATPGFMAQTASDLAAMYGFKVEIMDLDTARSLGMGAFAAVARGSGEPAFFIVLEHAPPQRGEGPPIVFIGKGITFDTGGISLKSRDRLEEMKQDMAGAASVLGLFEVIGRAGLKRHVVGVLPCAENMPGGRAYKPGDVLRSYSGQTVEIISTDAEGRLVLCDALAYAADRFKPSLIVDIATLTGASIVALGREVAAVLGNREDLVSFIQQAGASVGERFWPLPMWDFYFESLKSDVADMKNVGDRSAGTIIGAMFLNRFVPKQIPWAHLDIAGTAWTDKDTGFCPKGATGFGVRTLFEIVRRFGEKGF